MAKYVKYIGTSHWRQITRDEWSKLAMPVDQETLIWDKSNGWTVPKDRISDDAWPYIEADGEFIVVGDDSRVKEDAENPSILNIKEYPPLTTAGQAELMDQEELHLVDQVDDEVPDQHSGSVSIDGQPKKKSNKK